MKMNAILKQVPTAGVPLQTHGISKTYAAHKVLENVDFESLGVLFPAACGVNCMGERVYT